MATSYTFYNESVTLADTAKRLTTANVVLAGVDIQVQDYAADIGGRANQGLELSSGDILSYGAEIPVKLMDIWAKNHSAGSNAVLVVSGWIVNDN